MTAVPPPTTVTYRSKVMGKGHSACPDHLDAMLADMAGLNVSVRNVTDDHRTFRCGCGADAVWFLIEVEGVPVPGVPA